MSRLSLQVFYLWRHVLSTQRAPFILRWSNLEILFAPQRSPFIQRLRCQAIQTKHCPYITERAQQAVYIVRCLCTGIDLKQKKIGLVNLGMPILIPFMLTCLRCDFNTLPIDQSEIFSKMMSLQVHNKYLRTGSKTNSWKFKQLYRVKTKASKRNHSFRSFCFRFNFVQPLLFLDKTIYKYARTFGIWYRM
jgi:hypothetical protein